MLLVTGASGYIGRAVMIELAQHGHVIRTTTRALSALPDERAVFYDMRSEATLSAALFEGVSGIVHCAGIAHRRAATHDYRRLNVAATVRLAQAAAAAGVSQFVFVSSMNIVPTDSSAPDADAAEWPEPGDPYSASKWLAEQELKRVLSGTACDLHHRAAGLGLRSRIDRQFGTPAGAAQSISCGSSCSGLQNDGRSVGSRATFGADRVRTLWGPSGPARFSCLRW